MVKLWRLLMSIIDNKGKLFGKINIIDLIAVVLILAVVALLGTKLLSNDSVGLSGPGQPVVYTVKVENVDEDVYEFIQDNLPSQLMANDQLQDGYVTAVEATLVEEPSVNVQQNPTLNMATLNYDEAGTYDLVFTIEATVKDNLTSELGTQQIRVGKTHIVKTTTFELENGVIQSCERLEVAE